MAKVKKVVRSARKRAAPKSKTKTLKRVPPMVLRVARAIVRESRKPSVGISNPEALARAAMRAMRKPTKHVMGWAEMADIGSAWVATYPGKRGKQPVTFPLGIALHDTGCRDVRGALLNAWREMLDAALEAKPYHKPVKPDPSSKRFDGEVPF